MWPDDVELADEIRGHLAISINERIERGEDPEAARLAALREFGNVTLTRDSMRAVWRPGWLEMAEGFWHDIRIALRSLNRARGLATTVVVTLALGIGANAAIFSVVRAVVLRPLVNRDEDRLVYIRQSAPGIGQENTTFSVPEINDFKSRAGRICSFGDFSTVDFRLIGLGHEPRMVKAGVVGGSFFDVMGLRPVLGRLLNPQDDGPNAAGAAVLSQILDDLARQRSDRGRQDHPPRFTQRHGCRRPRTFGALPGRHRDHRERRDQSPSLRGHDGDQPASSDDGAVRTTCARCLPR